METIYQFELKNTSGKTISLKEYQNKVILIVNTASKCGFTPQFKDLELCYQKYKNKGFEILGIPSNNFGKQEPLVGSELNSFCELNYGVTFPIFEKTEVVGKQQHPLYHFLSKKTENGVVDSTPRWNFHKYLIDREGRVVDFYYSMTKPTGKKLSKAIEKLL